MAKYTETLAEYLEGGGTLPSSSFALVTDFEDLFKERFCGSEIGFETEALFAMKLDLKARLVMPAYAAKIAAVVAQLTGIADNPTKWRYETRVYGKQHSETKNDGSATELPINQSIARPSSTSSLDGSADTDEHTDTLEFKEGLSIDERLRIIDELNKKAFILTEAALDEFKPLFMGVY